MLSPSSENRVANEWQNIRVGPESFGKNWQGYVKLAPIDITCDYGQNTELQIPKIVWRIDANELQNIGTGRSDNVAGPNRTRIRLQTEKRRLRLDVTKISQCDNRWTWQLIN